jgi:HEPN domain-containing protein
MTVRDLANEWIDFAGRDIESARFLLGMRPIPREIICFHCQQCAEKAIKSILAFWDLEIPRIHALAELASLVNSVKIVLIGLDAELANLTQFSANIRYPPQKAPTDDDVHSAIAAAERVFSAVKTILG